MYELITEQPTLVAARKAWKKKLVFDGWILTFIIHHLRYAFLNYSGKLGRNVPIILFHSPYYLEKCTVQLVKSNMLKRHYQRRQFHRRMEQGWKSTVCPIVYTSLIHIFTLLFPKFNIDRCKVCSSSFMISFRWFFF